MKKLILFIVLLNTSILIAQSKKEQIETLNLRIDSLNSLIYLERNTTSQNILNFNSKISVLEYKIDSLSLKLKDNKDSLYKKELECSNLNIKFSKINNDLSFLETRLDSIKKAQLKNIEEINNPEKNVIPKSYFGHWVSNTQECNFDGGLYIENNDGKLSVSGLEWSSRSINIVISEEFYLLEITGFSEGEEFKTTIKCKMLDSGKLLLTKESFNYCCGDAGGNYELIRCKL